MFAEILLEDGVERMKIARIVEPDSTADDVFGSISCLGQDCEKVANCLVGLLGDRTGEHFAIEHGNLSRNVQPPVYLNGACERKMLTTSALAAFCAVAL